MTGIDLQLKQGIEDLLGMPSLAASLPGAAESLKIVSALAEQYLEQAIPLEMRPLAADVAAAARLGLSTEREAGFRSALRNLAGALEHQKEVEESASQFADDPEMVEEFLIEAREHLASVEAELLTIEREPDNAEALNAVFRSFHTIKGLAAFLGASAIQELAHETENVLDLARSGKIILSPDIVDLILLSADDLAACLDLAARGCLANGKLSAIPRRDRGLLGRLARAARGEGGSVAILSGTVLSEKTQLEEAALKESGTSGLARPRENVLRVDASKLEYLIDMVGELVIAEAVVRHDPAVTQSQEPLLARNLKQLARVVQEVQKTSMSMRMVSVSGLFRKMDRLIRDLGRKSGKMVELITAGEDVELDRSIVESLADPMVHMIRNAVDHGLEMPDERRRSGKSEQGSVRLKAAHDAGDIVIELSDDGRGLDAAKILAKAKRLGLVDEAEHPDEDAIFRLILEPGFSTAEKVTDLSGRGVGMDVVKKQIQKLRGRIAIRSTPGQGCTFALRLPLTLAIIDGLVVGVGTQRYILPMFAVREMFSPRPDSLVTIENRAEAVLFRDKLLPVVRLSRLLETSAAERVQASASSAPGGAGVLIVAEGRDELYCIAVDQLIGKQEVVIKSLGNTYRDIPAISGGSILGDGRVGLIIDVNALRDQTLVPGDSGSGL